MTQDPAPTPRFPDGFEWGTGTAAYQVEGAWDADGKVASVWDTAMHTRLRTPDGTSGDVAIDQYHRLDEDLDMLARLGAGAHRVSIAWPRVIVDDRGTINRAGLDYYDRVVDGLLARGVAPAVNLYHWDTPQWLEDRGGMMVREFSEWFADFADAAAQRLGDRVHTWFTMNEPTHPSLAGYVAGALPPFHKNGAAGLASVHHLLLAHGRAIQALRARGVAGQIGTILSMSGVGPATAHADDVRAAERAEYFEGRLFLDPMLGKGHLPELAKALGDVVRPGDEAVIAQPLDVLGMNWYSRFSAADPARAELLYEGAPPAGQMLRGFAAVTAPLGFAVVPTPGLEWGGAHRQITPGGLRQSLDWLAETYPDHPDVVITENGIGLADAPGADGVVVDSDRIRYHSWVLRELAEAIADGARVRGYHVWSAFDNLQWTAGFTQRFGLVHVDPHSLVRTPKASFDWYSRVVRDGVVPAGDDADAALSGEAAGIDLGGARNARGVGGLRTTDGGRIRSGVVYRSALLPDTDALRAAAQALNVRTVLDLRGDTEAASRPDRVTGARVVRLPLFEPERGAALASTPDLAAIYRAIVRSGGAIVDGIREIIASDGATLVHCTAGKDRTGVFIAIVLSAVGVGDAAVLSTYAESADRLGEQFLLEITSELDALGVGRAEVAPLAAALLASPPEQIATVLAAVREQHGSVVEYLFANGLTPDELAQLRALLVERPPA